MELEVLLYRRPTDKEPAAKFDYCPDCGQVALYVLEGARLAEEEERLVKYVGREWKTRLVDFEWAVETLLTLFGEVRVSVGVERR